MRAKRSRRSVEAARAGLTLVLALLLVACEKQPAVENKAPAVPAAAVAAKKIEQPASADVDKSAEAKHAAANAALTAKIKAALAAEPALKGAGIDVAAAEGNVSLFGTVRSVRQVTTAAKVASQVPGVTSVINKLVVLAGS